MSAPTMPRSPSQEKLPDVAQSTTTNIQGTGEGAKVEVTIGVGSAPTTISVAPGGNSPVQGNGGLLPCIGQWFKVVVKGFIETFRAIFSKIGALFQKKPVETQDPNKAKEEPKIEDTTTPRPGTVVIKEGVNSGLPDAVKTTTTGLQ